MKLVNSIADIIGMGFVRIIKDGDYDVPLPTED